MRGKKTKCQYQDYHRVSNYRGDHKQADKRKPIAAKLIAGMLEVSGVQQVITVDIHSPQTEGFFSIPVDCLTARFLFERRVSDGVFLTNFMR